MRILPMGYLKTSSGRTVGIIFGVFSVFLTVMAFVGGGGIIVASPFIAMAAVFLIGGFISDHTLNAKAARLTANMEELKKNMCVSGQITEIKAFYKLLFKEKEMQEGLHIKAQHRFYVVTVSFTDPHTGKERVVKSEKYSYFPLHEKVQGKLRMERCFDQENANVYVSPDGRTFIELLYKPVNE